MSFVKVIHDMCNVNPEVQKIIQHVLHTSMEPPYN
jgi:hypothetical protein